MQQRVLRTLVQEAAVVLLLSSPDKARAAVTQGTLPLIGIALLAAALL